MAQTSHFEEPVHIGSEADFALVRSALQAASFDEDTICRTLGIEAMSDVGSINLNGIDFTGVPEQFELLVRLFFVLRLTPFSEAERLLGRETLNAFLRLGLLGTGKFGVDDIYARVLLYPVGGFLLASDRHTNPDGSPFIAPSDIVFPAIYAGTLRFLRLLRLSPAETALDLCAGSGIGAFVLSRSCSQAVSSDVTRRATHFALFNRALNDRNNVEAVCGDLYSAVPGRKFDRIVAHPPYVPSLGVAAIWRDGGTTGETLVRRIIEGLPRHLQLGGIACVVSLGLDTNQGLFEERTRSWLQNGANEFDIIFASSRERTPDEVLRDLADQGLAPDQLRKLREAFVEAGIVGMPYGALFLRRHTTGDRHSAWTFRTKLSEATEGADFECAFALHTRFLDAEFVKRLAGCHPVLAPRLQVKVTHVVYEGALVPGEFIFETDKPFDALGRVDRWMIPLFTRFDGKLTPKEIYDKALVDGDLPEGFGLEDFNALVGRMIERGFLLLPEEKVDAEFAG